MLDRDLMLIDFMRRLLFTHLLFLFVFLQACGTGRVVKLEENLFHNEDTLYRINQAHDLGGNKLFVPKNCTLVFGKNGKLLNGELVGNDTKLISESRCVGVRLSGTWNVSMITDGWFDDRVLSDREILDNINVLQSDDLSQVITLNKKEYSFPIEVNDGVGINLMSNTILKLNTTLRLETCNLTTYNIINVVNKQNVTIIGGRIIGDVLAHLDVYEGKSEWGVGLNILNSHSVAIEDTYITKCWGDGIYIGGGQEREIGVYDNASRNVRMKGVVCDDNRRQGLSIIHVDSLLVTGCSFINTGKTKMTRPAAGVDIEPNLSKNRNQSCRNLLFVSCTMTGNEGKALTMYQNIRKGDVDNIEHVVLMDCDLDGWTVLCAPDINIENSRIKGTITARTYGSPVNAFFTDSSINCDVLSISMEPTIETVTPDYSFSFLRCDISVGNMKNLTNAVKDSDGITINLTDSKVSLSKEASKQLNRSKTAFTSKVMLSETNVIYE